ncbi:MAG: serine hydrolase domain-containing protein [Acidimicrobiia bacterium]
MTIGTVLAGALIAACSGGGSDETVDSTDVAITTPASTSIADSVAPAISATTEPIAATTTTTTLASATIISPPVVYPGATWATGDPAAAGFDTDALAALVATTAAANSTCLVIVKDGVVVEQQSWTMAPDAPREAFSVTKSVTSVLTGIASDDGAISLTDPAEKFIPEWRGTAAATVTITNLLTNDSGRHWDVITDYSDMAIRASDKTAFSIALAQDAPPGTTWAYNNAAIQTLSAVLESATGQPPRDYARNKLFDRIGMAHSEMGVDGAGTTMTFSGLRTTCLDLARFGYLMLNNGAWNGEQIVSKTYAQRATGVSSTPLNAAYGLLFWLNRPGVIASNAAVTNGSGENTRQGQLAPGAPDDVFWALGLGNQIVAVIPSERIVAVRMGGLPPKETPFTEAALTNGVLDALNRP